MKSITNAQRHNHIDPDERIVYLNTGRKKLRS